MVCIKKRDQLTHDPKPVCPVNFFEVGGIITGSVRLVYYLKVMKTALQHPCRTSVFKYICIHVCQIACKALIRINLEKKKHADN